MLIARVLNNQVERTIKCKIEFYGTEREYFCQIILQLYSSPLMKNKLINKIIALLVTEISMKQKKSK